MKVFVASLATETNTFSPMITGMAGYREGLYAPPGQHPDRPTLCSAPVWLARQRAKTDGWTVVEGLSAFAEPAGLTVRAVYEEMRDQIVEQLRAALPVDMVAIGLHGAMAAEGYDDCEGDLLTRLRDVVGPAVPLGAELDPHCHLSEAMLAAADVLVCFKEFPHTDFVDRGEDVLRLLEAMVAGRIRPVKSVHDCRMIVSMPTSREPMRSFVDRISALEGKDGILSVSVIHCFPYADVPEIGARILVLTDDRKAAGDALAETLGRELWDMRFATRQQFFSIAEALDIAATPGEGAGPVVLADVADNPGGGAPGDSTFVLRAVRERGLTGIAFAPCWDPVAVRMCFEAGIGGRFELRFGGKTGPMSGDPVDATVTVTHLARDSFQTFGTSRVPLGDVATIAFDGLEVVLITQRTQALGIDLFTNHGIDPATRRALVVKSTNHFYASFAPHARRIAHMDTPGSLPRDVRKLPYRRVPRPIFPLDENPFA